MCGRFVTNFSSDELVRYLTDATGIQTKSDPQAFAVSRYNAAPTQFLPVCRPNETFLEINALRWGLVPKWAKDASIGSKMINARLETVHEKPSFRGLVRHHRCVVPMRGFYEWLRPESGPKRPFYVTREDGHPMFVAGLWTDSPVLGDVQTFCSLTTESVGNLATIHNRAPVVIEDDEIDEWLRGDSPLELVRQSPRTNLCLLEVSTRVNSVRNDDPSLIDPLESGQLFS